MAFIPLIGGVKAEVKFLKNGQLVVNVYHFTTDDAIIAVNLTALGSAIKTAWDTYMKSLTSNTMSLEEIILTDVSEEDGIQVTYTTGLPLAGTGSADDLPSNVAVVISNRSIFTGRSNRGRTYLAGMTASMITGNVVSSTYQVAAISYHIEIMNDADDLSFRFGVASYVEDSAPRVTAAFQPFTTFQVENITDSQRRRLPGRGA